MVNFSYYNSRDTVVDRDAYCPMAPFRNLFDTVLASIVCKICRNLYTKIQTIFIFVYTYRSYIFARAVTQ